MQVLTSLDQRLREVEQWPTQLEVVLDLLDLNCEQEKLKQVKSKGSLKQAFELLPPRYPSKSTH